MAALLDPSSPYNPSAIMLQSCILSRHKPPVCSSASRLSSRRLTPRPLPSLLSLRAIALGDGFAATASESSWTEISEGITTEQAEECSVMEAADLSSFFVGYMEFCNSQSQRLPRNAAKARAFSFSYSCVELIYVLSCVFFPACLFFSDVASTPVPSRWRTRILDNFFDRSRYDLADSRC